MLRATTEMQLAPFEKKMWNSWSPNTPDHGRFDRDTYQRYDFKETPIVTEINREKLPRFVESLKLSNYIKSALKTLDLLGN